MSGKPDTTSRGVEDASLNKGGYYGEQPWMYTVLGGPREEFLKYIKNELVRMLRQQPNGTISTTALKVSYPRLEPVGLQTRLP